MNKSKSRKGHVYRIKTLEPDFSLFLFPVMGSDPHFSINVTKSRDIQLECKSRGWFPEPKMQWIDSHQGLIPSVSEYQTQDQSGLFHSSILLLVTETLQRNVTCSVWNPVLNLVKEGQLSIAGKFSLISHQHAPKHIYMLTALSCLTSWTQLCSSFIFFTISLS